MVLDIEKAEEIFMNLFGDPIFVACLIQHLARCPTCRNKFLEIMKDAKLIKGKQK